MRLHVDLTLPTEARLVSHTRHMVSGFMREMGVCSDDAEDVVLALDEACINVIRHAFDDDQECFHLSADFTDDEVVVVVEDDGIGLPPERASDSQPAADPWATSGRGLHIMREVMTSVDVETAPQRRGTRVEMRKSLVGPQ